MAISKDKFASDLRQVLAQAGKTEYLKPGNVALLNSWLFVPQTDPGTGETLEIEAPTNDIIWGLQQQISHLESKLEEISQRLNGAIANDESIGAQQIAANKHISEINASISDIKNTELQKILSQISSINGDVFANSSRINDIKIKGIGLDNEQIKTIIEQKIKDKIPLSIHPQLLGSWANSLLYQREERGMFASVAGKDANFMVAGKGIVTLFLALMGDEANLDSFEDISIAEWVYIGDQNNLQARSYLDFFGKYGLKEYGLLLWLTYKGSLGGYLIINADGSIYTSSQVNQSNSQ